MSDKDSPEKATPDQKDEAGPTAKKPAHKVQQAEGEIGGPKGLEPTRYGDWERKGIVSDF